MKGTLFAADFIKDSNKKLKLTDLQTDAGFYSASLADLDLSEWIKVLNETSVTKLHLVYKPDIHQNIVDKIVSTVEAEVPNIYKINHHHEKAYAVKARTVPDTASKFILRICYDERALLDKTYARKRFKLYNLFTDNNKSELVPEHYYNDGVKSTNTITPIINSENLPDAVVKPGDKITQKVNTYYKFFNNDESSSSTLWDKFIDKKYTEGNIIERLDYDLESSLGNKFTTYRQYGIVYGNELKYIPILQQKIAALYTLPDNLSEERQGSSPTLKLPKHHHYEFNTGFLKLNQSAIYSNEQVVLWDGTSVNIKDTTSDDEIISLSGIEPSKVESSVTEIKSSNTYSITNSTLVRVTTGNTSTLLAAGTALRVNDRKTDTYVIKLAIQLIPFEDVLEDKEGNTKYVTKVEVVTTSDSKAKLTNLDTPTPCILEDGEGSTAILVDHNYKPFIF